MKTNYSQIQYEHFTKSSYITGSSVDRRRHQGNYPQTLDNQPTAQPHNKHDRCRVAQIESLASPQCKNNNNRKIIFAFLYTVLLFMKNMQTRAANKTARNKSYQAQSIFIKQNCTVHCTELTATYSSFAYQGFQKGCTKMIIELYICVCVFFLKLKYKNTINICYSYIIICFILHLYYI